MKKILFVFLLTAGCGVVNGIDHSVHEYSCEFNHKQTCGDGCIELDEECCNNSIGLSCPVSSSCCMNETLCCPD